MKKCSYCFVEKAPEEFTIRRASSDGLGYICKVCCRERSKKWREANREAHRAYSRQWQKDHKDRVNERSRVWRERNKERRAEIANGWGRRNREYRRAKLAERRRKFVTPAWADLSRIAEFYRRAVELERETGVKYHVDHIVPINSDLVCGLHVESNLQVITARENILKRNLVWPDMP